jgi:hypothetical protein
MSMVRRFDKVIEYDAICCDACVRKWPRLCKNGARSKWSRMKFLRPLAIDCA